MSYVSPSRAVKRKLAVSVSQPPSKPHKVILLNPSHLLLEIPADTNTSLPVWDAMRSQQLRVAWSVSPYSISVHLTPVTSEQGNRRTALGKREGTSSVLQTCAASSSILQPQRVVQSVTQQHDSSCVLLACFPDSMQSLPGPPGQLQKIPPNPNPASSLTCLLPLIITQPPARQPSTPTEKGSPTATCTRLQAPSKVPVPSPFHTRRSTDVQICDSFLLSVCRAGKRCRMHHTPYPFHWQLWCVSTRQWIDIPPRAQVLLERIYSNVNKEHVYIKDGLVSNVLNFESMELDDSSKYGEVRRLTNSDSLVRNPYFPNKWKLYWWNNFKWEEYNETVSTCLLKKMSEKEPECSFYVNSEEYTVDFTTMHQTNVTTGFQREIRCRPVYRSPESLQPHLQTGILPEPAGDPPGANFSVDPLGEFSSWYPPVWCPASERDYSLVDVPAGTQAYRVVQNFFYESLPENRVDVIGIQQVQNLLHWDKYQRHKAHMQKQHTRSKERLERHLFHGTTTKASKQICHNNFDPRVAGVNGTSCGFGSYFATSASFSDTYSNREPPDEVRHMFLAKVLVGKVSLGKRSYRRPPPLKSKTRQHCLYDTCVDNVNNPTMFVVFDSCQCYPYYLIKYKELPKEIDIS